MLARGYTRMLCFACRFFLLCQVQWEPAMALIVWRRCRAFSMRGRRTRMRSRYALSYAERPARRVLRRCKENADNA